MKPVADKTVAKKYIDVHALATSLEIKNGAFFLVCL